MFDGLKDKLGSFREEAEEAAEENAEPVEDEELDGAPPDGDAAEDASTVAEDASTVAEDGPTDVEDVPTDGEDASADGEDGLPDGQAASARDASVQDPSEDASASETAETDADEASTSGADAERTDDAPRRKDLLDGGPAPQEAATDDASGDRAEGNDVADDADETGDDGSSTGFAKKAKSFTKGKFVVEEEDLEGPLQTLEMALLASDVELEVAQALLDRIREELVGETRTFTTSTGAVVEDALREALLDVISVGQFDFDRRIDEADKPVVITFTGVNGVGKTTSIAKLVRYLEELGHDSVVANGDTFRAGANEQIEEHAENLGVKLIAHEQGGDPAAVIYDAVEYAEANDVDVVLGDTAGRLHTSDGLMDQLAKIDRVVDPDVTIFVDEAVAGQDAVNRAREFDEAAEIDGSILTKADADAQGGAAISISHVTGKPILFLGTGQGYDDVERFDPEWLVDQLLEE